MGHRKRIQNWIRLDWNAYLSDTLLSQLIRVITLLLLTEDPLFLMKKHCNAGKRSYLYQECRLPSQIPPTRLLICALRVLRQKSPNFCWLSGLWWSNFHHNTAKIQHYGQRNPNFLLTCTRFIIRLEVDISFVLFFYPASVHGPKT